MAKQNQPTESLPTDAATLQRLYDSLEKEGADWLKGTNDLKRTLVEDSKKKLGDRERAREAFVLRKGRVFRALQEAKAKAAGPVVAVADKSLADSAAVAG